jgi:hypothetical protein
MVYIVSNQKLNLVSIYTFLGEDDKNWNSIIDLDKSI